MMKQANYRGSEGGSTLLEFVFVATTFFMMLLAITSGANLYFVHNALVEATRRSARFAAMQAATNPAGTPYTTNGACDSTSPSVSAIQNFAAYGNALGTGTRLVNSLGPNNFCVHYESFAVGSGSVSVSVIGYNYYVVIPFVTKTLTMPSYKTTFRGESAGALPAVCP
jgi:Flp pilus assembly protein TadG